MDIEKEILRIGGESITSPDGRYIWFKLGHFLICFNEDWQKRRSPEYLMIFNGCNRYPVHIPIKDTARIQPILEALKDPSILPTCIGLGIDDLIEDYSKGSLV